MGGCGDALLNVRERTFPYRPALGGWLACAYPAREKVADPVLRDRA
jgi:hypothetical protein